MSTSDDHTCDGDSRRALLRKIGVAGAVTWTAPAILTTAAGAQGSAPATPATRGEAFVTGSSCASSPRSWTVTVSQILPANGQWVLEARFATDACASPANWGPYQCVATGQGNRVVNGISGSASDRRISIRLRAGACNGGGGILAGGVTNCCNT